MSKDELKLVLVERAAHQAYLALTILTDNNFIGRVDREHHTKFEDRTKEIALLIRGLQRDLDNLGFSLTYD